MCGICGKLEYDEAAQVDPKLLDKMMDAIAHRGPDGRGSYTSGPVGLGHTRLAIIDLSTGAQPITNEDQTVWLVYNGEVYNFPELRAELIEKGHQFRSTTDSEVIVHLYEEYGVESLSRLQGMFAFAIWDERKHLLLLARDRVGIKPLYYVESGNALIFGSEIKALLAVPGVNCQLEAQSVDKFLTHLCLPGRETLWAGIYKLEPGSYLVAEGGKIKREVYWDLRFEKGARGSFAEAAEELRERTEKTVHQHMISDVPVGFLLSGGVDSTIVLSCAAKETNRKLKTFTVGFENAHFQDERPFARLASQRFNTEHHEITVTAREFWNYLPTLVWHLEEPICDPPAVALHYVSKLARQHVTVLLSGEGGDEAFGGYHDYRNFLHLENLKAALPSLCRSFSSVLALANRFGPLRKAGKFAPFFITAPQDYYYSRASSPFSYFNRNKANLYSAGLSGRISANRSLEVIHNLFEQVRGEPLVHQLQYIDSKTCLPDDLLIKADRITMGNSLELRVPFLDHELLEFAASLPVDFKVKGLKTKRILKEAFRATLPPEISNRRKAGFPIPIEKWLRFDLRKEVGELLLGERALARGLFQKTGIESLLTDLDRGLPVAKEVFALITLELLLREFDEQPKRTEAVWSGSEQAVV